MKTANYHKKWDLYELNKVPFMRNFLLLRESAAYEILYSNQKDQVLWCRKTAYDVDGPQLM